MNTKSLPKLSYPKYMPTEIEGSWQEKWIKQKTFHPDIDNAKKPYFALMMFPYPSAEGMHVGNMYAFTGSDIHGRFKRMQGHDVLEPIGLDGFGIHSENYALKIGRHPMDQAQIAEKNFYRQLKATGNSFDWDRTVETYAPGYYAWTQWLFIQLFKAGLAYKKNAPVNFCPSCKTVLADEQVEDGKCERCSSIVEKKDLEQWFFRITDYAEELLANIPTLNWADKVRIAQKKWIGKKDGINITYSIKDSPEKLTVFTTRPDTNFGATFIALAPENPLALKISSAKNKPEVEKYIANIAQKSADERKQEGREKTGVFTGAYAINELTGYEMPVWVSDFVLEEFGTGAIVGVPAHDMRDFEFAQKFDLQIIRVVTGKNGDTSEITSIEQVQEEEETMVSSDFLNGLVVTDAKAKIMDYLESKGYGKKQITYHLRDWLISRQRYWGAPIPMIFCQACSDTSKSWFDTVEAKEFHKGKNLKAHTNKDNSWANGWYPVSDKELPVELPYIDNYKPLGTGKSPLASYPEYYETNCPECGSKAVRETDVCDTFLDSSWYFLRYTSTDLNDRPFDIERVKKWLPVNMYIGGAEHSVLHLLYSRFVTMVLKDLGMIDFDEPFAQFYAHGLLIKEGAKMSKSKGNVIVPDEYINKYGVDTLRTYLMFLGPFNQGGDFYDSGIQGIYKFLKRVWKTYHTIPLTHGEEASEMRSFRHEIIKGVTEDVTQLRYNTAIAKLMTYYNLLAKVTTLHQADAEAFLKMLAPFAPHMTEELWQEHLRNTATAQKTGGEFDSIHLSAWPEFDEKCIEQKEHIVAIQINGKLRGSMTVSEELLHNEKEVTKLAAGQENVRRHIEGKKIIKSIYIAGKIINFVIS